MTSLASQTFGEIPPAPAPTPRQTQVETKAEIGKCAEGISLERLVYFALAGVGKSHARDDRHTCGCVRTRESHDLFAMYPPIALELSPGAPRCLQFLPLKSALE